MDWPDYLDQAMSYRHLAQTAESPLVEQEFLELAVGMLLSFSFLSSPARPTIVEVISHFLAPRG